MSEIIRARVEERLVKLYLGAVAQRLDAILAQAARGEPTYLDFLDQILSEETEAKQKKRVVMGIQIAHFPAVKTLDDFDFRFQPSVDQKLVRELATGRFVATAENVLIFGPPGVGKTHLAVALGRARRECADLGAPRGRKAPSRGGAGARRRRGRPLCPLCHRHDVAGGADQGPERGEAG